MTVPTAFRRVAAGRSDACRVLRHLAACRSRRKHRRCSVCGRRTGSRRAGRAAGHAGGAGGGDGRPRAGACAAAADPGPGPDVPGGGGRACGRCPARLPLLLRRRQGHGLRRAARALRRCARVLVRMCVSVCWCVCVCVLRVWGVCWGVAVHPAAALPSHTSNGGANRTNRGVERILRRLIVSARLYPKAGSCSRPWRGWSWGLGCGCDALPCAAAGAPLCLSVLLHRAAPPFLAAPPCRAAFPCCSAVPQHLSLLFHRAALPFLAAPLCLSITCPCCFTASSLAAPPCDVTAVRSSLLHCAVSAGGLGLAAGLAYRADPSGVGVALAPRRAQQVIKPT